LNINVDDFVVVPTAIRIVSMVTTAIATVTAVASVAAVTTVTTVASSSPVVIDV
jgi:hypothetical protein